LALDGLQNKGNQTKMSVHENSTPSKLVKSNAGERELLLSALRVATARSKLATNVFDSIGVSLRQQKIDCDQALAWLRDEGLLDHVDLGPPVSP
jgi:hypothetical protein